MMIDEEILEKRKKEWRTFFIMTAVVLLVVLVFFGPQLKYGKESEYTKSLKRAGKWFHNNQDGFFLYYQYDPGEQKHLTGQHPLREMASMWSVGVLGNALGDSSLTSLAERGFIAFSDTFQTDEENGFVYVGVTEYSLKLGYSAFAILTLLEIEHPMKDYYLREFADGILHLQQEDGSFNTYFYGNDTSGQDYYPGEALLALMSLYEYNGDERCLSAVGKAFPYYRDYWTKNKNTAFPPWQSRAYLKYYRATGDENVITFLYDMSDWMVLEYRPKSRCAEFDFEWYGITSPVHVEGVIQGYELAVEQDDELRIGCYGNYIQEGLDYILTTQVVDTNDDSSRGGWIGHDGLMRVDRQQHAVLAIIGACNAEIVDCGL